MCLGHTHAVSGLVTGSAVGLYAPALRLGHVTLGPGHLTPGHLVLFVGLTSGAAVLPDLDHPNSTLARSFGFLSHGFARLVGKVSGGHRHLTHAILGVAGFTALAWLAVKYRHDIGGKIGLGVFLALIVAGALYAISVEGHGADALAIAAAVVMIDTGFGLSLVALAVGVGCSTHVLGDMLTEEGCPLLYPLSRWRFRLLPRPLAFTTGTRPEFWILNPLLAVSLGWLIYLGASMGVIKPKL